MTNTVDEYWTWEGLSLQQPWLGISTIGGTRFGVPTLRGQDIEVPYAAGLQWRPKYPNARTITLVMWVLGVDQTTGNPAADQRLAWNNNWQQIRQAFWTRGALGSSQGTLTRQWYLTQGGSTSMVSASAKAEVAGTMEPTMSGRYRAAFSVDLLLADPYFYGAQQTQTLAYNTAATVDNLGEGVVGEGTGTWTVQLNGPLTNPTVTNNTAGVSVSYGASIVSGHYVTLDVANYTAVDDAGISQISNVTHSGSRIWLPLVSGSNTLQLTSTNSADTGTAALTWQPAYI